MGDKVSPTGRTDQTLDKIANSNPRKSGDEKLADAILITGSRGRY